MSCPFCECTFSGNNDDQYDSMTEVESAEILDIYYNNLELMKQLKKVDQNLFLRAMYIQLNRINHDIQSECDDLPDLPEGISLIN